MQVDHRHCFTRLHQNKEDPSQADQRPDDVPGGLVLRPALGESDGLDHSSGQSMSAPHFTVRSA